MIKGINGKPIKINKKGIIYPVDVVLSSESGKDILTITSRIKFIPLVLSNEIDFEGWKLAVLNGMRDWSGDYLVFGNQPIRVNVNVTETKKKIDSIFVYCIDEEMRQYLVDVYGKYNLKKAEQMFSENRPCASIGFLGLNWKSYLPRFIYLFYSTLDDFDYAQRVAKHEFGHVLGIGDLYRDLEKGLPGVDGLEYEDLKPYFQGNYSFDAVMCNNGPVRDNDIEMLLLAFQTNKFQNYQKIRAKDKISEALGIGN